jgi:hypothetical protein
VGRRMPLTRKRVLILSLEILLVIAAGIAVAGALLFYAAVGPFSWMPSVRWWSLAGTTALVFWAVVKQFRHHWHRLSFWLEIAGLLAAHLSAYTVVLLRVPRWRLVWFVPASVVEGGVLVLVLAKVAGRAL